MDDLTVSVGADITGFLSKIEAMKARIGQLTESQQGLKGTINDLNTSLRLNEKELTTAAVKLQKLNTTTTHGKNEAAALRKEIAQLATNSKTLGGSLEVAKTNLASTTANLKKASVELKTAEKATGGFSSGISKTFSGLRMLANIIPGLGIGGIFALAVEGVRAFVSALNNANKAQAELNEAMAKAAGSVAGEVAQMRSLVSIAKDTSLSYETRTQAVKQLNKEYPELHGNITLENIGTDKITNAINNQIEAIKRRAQAKALEKLIDKESEKLEVAQVERLAKVAEQTKRQRGDFQKGANEVAKFLGAPGLFAERSDAAEHFNDIIKKTTSSIDLYTKKLNELNTEGAKTGTLFVEPPKTAKAVKSLETINDVLAKMRAEIVVLSKQELFFGTNESLAKIKLLENTVTELFRKFKLAADNIIVLKLGFEAADLREREELRKEIFKILPPKVDVPVSLTLAKGSADLVFKGQLPKVVLPEVEKLNQQIADNLKAGLNEALVGVGESIGQALAEGGDIGKGIFSGLFKIIAQGLKEMGKAMVALGTAKIAIEKFAFAPGIGTVIAGIATIAIAQLLQATIPKFAVGGPVMGPGSSTSDSILARLSRGEFVMKASVVDKFGTSFFEMLNRGFMPPKMATGGSIGSGSIGGAQLIEITGDFEIRGDKLVAVVQRAQNRLNRNG